MTGDIHGGVAEIHGALKTLGYCIRRLRGHLRQSTAIMGQGAGITDWTCAFQSVQRLSGGLPARTRTGMDAMHLERRRSDADR